VLVVVMLGVIVLGVAVLGVAVLHESFTMGMAVGFVLVIAGSVLATRRPRERAVALSAESQSSV